MIKDTSVYFSGGLLGALMDFGYGRPPILLPQECPSMQRGIDQNQNAVKLLGVTREPRPDL